MIRKAFVANVNRRFHKLSLAVTDFIDDKDALGLKEKKMGVALNVTPREFEFRTDAGKLQAFQQWFKQQVEANIFSTEPGTPFDEPWTTEYVTSAYKRGIINSYLAAKRADKTLTASQATFLAQSFNTAEALAKVKFLATRSFTGLQGITATMDSQLNLILAKGMADGSSVVQIAREMVDKIDGLTASRALTLARTEIINAHSEGQLDAYDKLGIKELGIQVEWSTAGDDRVCPICAAREGQIMSVDEARGIIPIHPNCRCAWLPATSGLLKSLGIQT